MREKRNPKNVCRIITTFFELIKWLQERSLLTVERSKKHAKTYSQTYKKVTAGGRKILTLMARKTVIKNLLSKWGVLSIEMQTAIKKDQVVYDGENEEYIDNEQEPIVYIGKRQREELMELAKGKQEQAMQILQERGIKSIKDITVNDYESVKAELEKLSKGEG